MKKMLLVDGNSMFFRAYYATAYTRMSTTSFGVPTNAVYGFVAMLNKALDLVKPQALVIAFDSGHKTFRHDRFEAYKGTRKELPADLVAQFPLVREYCEAANLCYYEHNGLEADDIIGSLVKRYPDWDINILSSDKDLLQLIDDTTSVWLMKKGLTEIVEMDAAALKEMWGLEPHQVIDLKGLMGDSSDNIPGLPGVGEKTALKLVQTYGSVEALLENTHELKGKLLETVTEFAEQARFSKWLATIKTDAELDVQLESTYFHPSLENANAFFEKYEMKSMIKELALVQEVVEAAVDLSALDFTQTLSVFAHYRLDSSWPHPFLGLALSDGTQSAYVNWDELIAHPLWIERLNACSNLIVYDLKSMVHAGQGVLQFSGEVWDVMLMSFIHDSNINNYAELAAQNNLPDLPQATLDSAQQDRARQIANKMHSLGLELKGRLTTEGLEDLYRQIDLPLVEVLVDMERTGIRVDSGILDDIAAQTLTRLNALTEVIHGQAKQSFNINSPKQLAQVLFDDLGLPSNRKQSTAIEVLEALRDQHPIIEPLIEYRKYQKIYSTYAVGLKKFVREDGRIHTVFNQTIAQTGRLSSTDPNLQNISIRDEEARAIRKAFVASPGHVLFSCDYSQIELRVLAHMAQETTMIEAFKANFDIHTKTAMDVFNLEAHEVGAQERRQAKAVNFGIIYGISDFGLAQQLNTDRTSAKAFIDQYLKRYGGIQTYMDEAVASCKAQGYVETLFKRRRLIPDIDASNYTVREFAKRAAMNAPIQGTAADIMKLAMIQVHQTMKQQGMKSKLLLQVHDELVFDVLESEFEVMSALVQEAMRSATQLDVPLDVSIAHGPSWYEAK
jgi:DNA polymerase-1